MSLLTFSFEIISLWKSNMEIKRNQEYILN